MSASQAGVFSYWFLLFHAKHAPYCLIAVLIGPKLNILQSNPCNASGNEKEIQILALCAGSFVEVQKLRLSDFAGGRSKNCVLKGCIGSKKTISVFVPTVSVRHRLTTALFNSRMLPIAGVDSNSHIRCFLWPWDSASASVLTAFEEICFYCDQMLSPIFSEKWHRITIIFYHTISSCVHFISLHKSEFHGQWRSELNFHLWSADNSHHS